MAVSARWKILAVAAALSGALVACGGDDKGSGDDKEATKADAASGNNTPLGDVPMAQLEANVAGKVCKADTDCGGTNATCAKDPNDAEAIGTCTGVCDGDKQCGTGGTCVKISDNIPGGCAKVCDSASQCGSAELDCVKGVDFGELASQFQSFLSDAGINLGSDAGLTANATPKTCQPKGEEIVTLPANTAGKACTEDSDCGGGTCTKMLPFVGTPYPGGYCTTACLEDSTCGTGGGCARPQLAVTLNQPGGCYQKCTSTTECRMGYECNASPLLGAGKYCILPGRQSGDAGVRDASVPDASAQDAGVPDAAPDAAPDAT